MKNRLYIAVIVFFIWGCATDGIKPADSAIPVNLIGNWDGIPQHPFKKPDELYFISFNHDTGAITGVLTIFYSTGDNNTIQITAETYGNKIVLKTLNSVYFDCVTLHDGTGFNCTGRRGKILFTVARDDTSVPQDTFINAYELEKLGGAGSPIILIHGMYSNKDVWNAFGLLDNLKQSGLFDRHEVWTYQYDWTAHINDTAWDLLRRTRQRGISQPTLVAHSMGGLVARSFVALGGEVKKIITLASPHSGFPVDKLSQLVKWFDVPGGHDLQHDSGYLKWINSDPRDVANRHKYATYAGMMGLCCHEAIDGKCIKRNWCATYPGWLKLTWLAIDTKNDGIVPVESAELFPYAFIEKYLSHVDFLSPSKTGLLDIIDK